MSVCARGILKSLKAVAFENGAIYVRYLSDTEVLENRLCASTSLMVVIQSVKMNVVDDRDRKL